MAKPEVLSRVVADLGRGDARLATRRLGSLLAADPQDLEVRARLAGVYRAAGDAAEAGRWGFLTEDVEPHEIAAFARKHRSAGDRLRLLRLRGESPRGLGPLAEPRYAELAALAAVEIRAVEPAVPAPAEPAVPAVPAPGAAQPRRGWFDADTFNLLQLFGFVAVVIGYVVYEVVVAIYQAFQP